MDDNPLAPVISLAGSMSEDGNFSDADEEELLLQKLNSTQSPRNRRRRESESRANGPAEPTFTLRELKRLKNMFDESPTDGMSMIDFVKRIGPEFQRVSPSATNRDIELLFKRIDANANQCVDWDEFSAFLLMNDVKATLKLTAEAKSKDFAPQPSSKESQLAAHHALRHVLHKEPINRLIIHPKLPRYFTSSADGMVKCWNAENLRHLQTLQASSAAVTDMVLTSWHDSVAVLSMDNTISFYASETGDLVRCYQGERMSRVGGKIRSSDQVMDDKPAVIRRPKFAIPVNRQEGDEIKYGRTSDIFGKVDTTVPVLSHFNKPQELPAISLSNFGSALEGRHLNPVQAGYPSAIDVCTLHGESTMFVGFDNGYLQLFPLNQIQGILGTDVIFERPKETIRMHWDHVSKLIAVPQMDLLFSSSFDGMIQVRNFDRLDEVNTLLGEGIVVSDRKKPGGFGTGGAAVHDTTLHGHAHRVTSMDWNYECRLIASCAPEKDVLIWSPYIPKPVTKLDHPKGLVVGVQFMKANDQIMTLSNDKVVRLWDIRTYRCVQTLTDVWSPHDDVNYAQYDHKRECVVLGSTCLRTWGLVQTTEYHRKYSGHRRPVVALVVSIPFRQIITADHRMIVVWDLGSLEPVMRWEVDTTIADICLDNNGRRLIVAMLGGKIEVFNYVNGLLLKTMNAGGVESLLQYHQEMMDLKKRVVNRGSPTGKNGGAASPSGGALSPVTAVEEPSKPLSREAEVTCVRFADVTKPRATSVIATTLDNGITAIYLDEEGAENRPMRTVKVQTTCLTTHVDAGYNILIIGHHAGISSSGLDETTSAATSFTPLPPSTTKGCKIALFIGSLTDDPVAKSRYYLQNREEIIFGQPKPTQPLNVPSPGGVSPTKRQATRGASPHRGNHSSSPSGANRARQPSTVAMPRKSIRALSIANQQQFMHDQMQAASVADLGKDLEMRQLQSLGLVEKIVLMQSIDPHVIITGSSDGLIQFWNIKTTHEIFRFRATPTIDAVTSLCLTTDEDALIVGDASGYISIFDLTKILEAHDSVMQQFASQDAMMSVLDPLIAGPTDVTITEEFVTLRVRFRAHTEAISCIGLDEGVLAGASNSGRVDASSKHQPRESCTSLFNKNARRRTSFFDPNYFVNFVATDVIKKPIADDHEVDNWSDSSPKSSPRHSPDHSPRHTHASPKFTVEVEDFDDIIDDQRKRQSKKKKSVSRQPTFRNEVKIFTGSADTYAYVWVMERSTCQTKLVGCLGDPVFIAAAPRQHPQTLAVYDHVRKSLIEQYLAAEGKCTWGMLVAHYTKVVEKRRLSLFSTTQLHAGEEQLHITYTTSGTFGSDDDGESPSSRSKGTDSTARSLLRDMTYVGDCCRAFDPLTFDDLSLDGLLRRLVGNMISPNGTQEAVMEVDDEGFYSLTAQRRATKLSSSGSEDLLNPLGKLSRQQRASESVAQRRETQPVNQGYKPSATAAQLATSIAVPRFIEPTVVKSQDDDAKASLSANPADEFVEVYRPPRHLIDPSNPGVVHNPPDISDVLASADAPKTLLVGPAKAFTGVFSVHRGSATSEPFLDTEKLTPRGEIPYSDDGQQTTVTGPTVLQCTPSALALAVPSTTFLTELSESDRRQKHDFMRSVLSYYGGDSPRTVATPSGRKSVTSNLATPRGSRPQTTEALVLNYLGTPPTTSRSRKEVDKGPTSKVLSVFDEGYFIPPPPVKEQPQDDLGQPIPLLVDSAQLVSFPPLASSSTGPMTIPQAPLARTSTLTTSMVERMASSQYSLMSSPYMGHHETLTELCRAQTFQLDDMVSEAILERNNAKVESRRFHLGVKPMWEATEAQQRELKKLGGTSTTGGFIVVKDEDEVVKVRALRSVGAMGGKQRVTPFKKPPKTTATQEDKDTAAQKNLNLFRNRAVDLIGEDGLTNSVIRLNSARQDSALNLPLISPRAKSAKGKSSDGEGKKSRSGQPPTEGEILGNLQWVSRIHSLLEVPRTHELAPAPAVLKQSQSDQPQLTVDDGVDYGWLRLLTTARSKKPQHVVRTTAKSKGKGTSPKGDEKKKSPTKTSEQPPRPPPATVHKPHPPLQPRRDSDSTAPTGNENHRKDSANLSYSQAPSTA